jgi:hypothetical protein
LLPRLVTVRHVTREGLHDGADDAAAVW